LARELPQSSRGRAINITRRPAAVSVMWIRVYPAMPSVRSRFAFRGVQPFVHVQTFSNSAAHP
jgi:hypothetical protein